MNLGVQLILLIIFGIVGFITDKIWGINPYKIFSDIGTAIFIIILTFLVFPVTLNSNPDTVIKSIENLVIFFAESLPSIIIGDIAGTIVSKLIGERK